MSGGDQLVPLHVAHAGARLFGMLHLPAGGAARVAVICLSSGLQNRAGPHRIYVKAARRFTELGLAVLRLDLAGVGDSDGHVAETHFDCHDPAPVATATAQLAREHGIERVVLLGLCAGARVAIKGAARAPHVDAVVAWGMPIVSGPVNMPVSQGGGAYISRREAGRQLREWLPKLVDPRAWYRYLRKEDGGAAAGWRMMSRALGGLVPERLRQPTSPQQDFFRSLDGWVAARRPLLLLYGEEDTLGRGELLDRFPALSAGEDGGCTLGVVPAGDHTFTRIAATAEAVERTAAWLARRYPR